MKITGSINAQSTIFSRKPLGSPAEKGKSPFASRTYDLGKYDTFTMVGGEVKTEKQSFAERFKANNAELIRKLEGMSEEEKAETAAASYLDMQKTVLHKIQSHENKIDYFNELKDEEAYYNGLLNGDGKVRELYKRGDTVGGYAHLDLKIGETANKDELLGAVARIRERLDALVNPKESGFTDLSAKAYTASGVIFGIVTGISDDVLSADGDTDLLDRIEGINEDNFVEKQRETINKLENRSQKLKDVMTDYIKHNDSAKELMKDPARIFKNNDKEESLNAMRRLKELEQLKELAFARKDPEKDEREEESEEEEAAHI
ncbi:MAG: hypothetical protein NC394_01500 [Bacteroides sp.]|nr:hypothetical protein [Bacteroides sp.]